MSPETRDPKRLQKRWLARLDALLSAGPDAEARADLVAQRAFWEQVSYRTLNDLVNCYEP